MLHQIGSYDVIGRVQQVHSQKMGLRKFPAEDYLNRRQKTISLLGLDL